MTFRSSFSLWLVLGLLTTAASPLHSQQKEAERNPDAADLRRQLEAIDAEIAEQEQQLAQARASWADELAAREQTRKTLAGRLVGLELRSETLRVSLNTLAGQAETNDDRSVTFKAVGQKLVAAAELAAEQLAVHLGEVPTPNPATAGSAREALAALGGKPALEGAEATLASLLSATAEAHSRALAITIESTDLRTASGQLESAELLSIGAVAFAYRTSDGRFGLALRSPKEASGFRWSEDLDPDVSASIRRAFDVATGQGGGPLLFPVDVTGTLGAENALRRESLGDVVQSGGPVMIALGVVALVAAVLILERLWALSRAGSSGEALLRRVLAACEARDFSAAEAACKSAGGTVARMLLACLGGRDRGTQVMEDCVQEQLLYEWPRLQRFLGGLTVLAAVAPLLGLLGTVTGIIKTFGVIKALETTSPSLLAGGISEALITTATGLIVAIPILLLQSALAGRAESLLGSAEKQAATLLTTLAAQE